MDSSLRPAVPDPATVAEVIRLAEDCEAERFEQRTPEHLEHSAADIERYLQPRPRWYALVAYLRRLPEATVASLYAIYRLGDLPRPNAREATARYLSSFELAMEPMHRANGHTDLAAKGPLADGLRRGLERLGLTPDWTSPGPAYSLHAETYLED